MLSCSIQRENRKQDVDREGPVPRGVLPIHKYVNHVTFLLTTAMSWTEKENERERMRRGGGGKEGEQGLVPHIDMYVHWGPTTPGRCSLPCQYFPLASLTIPWCYHDDKWELHIEVGIFTLWYARMATRDIFNFKRYNLLRNIPAVQIKIVLK